MIAFPLNWATGDKSQLVHEHAKRVEIILLDGTIGNWPYR
jgi:hypothetical protein